MARIKRAKVHRQLVAVDSNILWHKSKDLVVAPDFEEFWDSHSGKFDLCLVVPDIVRGELLFQQTMSALNALKKANEALAEAAAIGASSYNHRVTDPRIRKDVAARFDSWLKKRKAKVVTVPFAQVDWAAMAEASIWRTGPFAIDAKTPDDEKGFRDALILESVIALSAGVHSDEKVAFVTNDRVLRDATAKRMSKSPNAAVFESLKDLSSFLRLLDEKLTRQFVVAIQSKVRSRFYTPGDNSSLYLSEDVPGRVRREHPVEFTWFGDIGSSPQSPLINSSLLTILGRTPWRAVSNEVIWLMNPEFQRLDGAHDFHWKSQVRWVQLFRQERVGTLLTTGPAEERLRSLVFDVHFHSKVRANGRVESIELSMISVAEKSFAPTSDEELARLQVVRSDALTPPAAG